MAFDWSALAGDIVGTGIGAALGQSGSSSMKRTAKVQRQLMRQQMDQSGQVFDQYKSHGMPLERSLSDEAMRAGSQEEQDEEAARAGHSVAQAFKGGDLQLRQSMDPSSPDAKHAALTRQNVRDVTMGAAQNEGRRYARDQGFAKRMDAAGLFRGMPGTAVSGMAAAARTNSDVYDMEAHRAGNIAAGLAPIASGIGAAVGDALKRTPTAATPTYGGYYAGSVPAQASLNAPSAIGWNFKDGGLVRRHGNGMIEGPGTGTSDSVPALVNGREPVRLSDGEMVMNREAVRIHGPALERMNADGLKRRGYAQGGMITAYHDDGTPFPVSEADYDLSTMHPNEDAVANAKTFKQAFAAARKAGLKDFLWQGKPYTTQLAGEKPGAMPEHMKFRDAFRKARNAGLAEFTWRGNRYNTKLKQGPAEESVTVSARPLEVFSEEPPLTRSTHGDARRVDMAAAPIEDPVSQDGPVIGALKDASNVVRHGVLGMDELYPERPMGPIRKLGHTYDTYNKVAERFGLRRRENTYDDPMAATPYRDGQRAYADGGRVVSDGRGYAWWRGGTKKVRGVRNAVSRDFRGGAPDDVVPLRRGNYAPVEERSIGMHPDTDTGYMQREADNVLVRRFRPGRDGGGVPLDEEPMSAGAGGLERTPRGVGARAGGVSYERGNPYAQPRSGRVFIHGRPNPDFPPEEDPNFAGVGVGSAQARFDYEEGPGPWREPVGEPVMQWGPGEALNTGLMRSRYGRA